MSSPSSRHRSNKSFEEPKAESPLSDRSPRRRGVQSKKRSASSARAMPLSPKTPLPVPGSGVQPKHPRRYSTENKVVAELRMEEVHRPTDRVVHVDLEELEKDVRGGTPSSSLSVPTGDRSLLDASHLSSSSGPRTSTPIKSSKSRRAPPSLYKQALMKSASRTGFKRPHADSTMDSYRTAQESLLDSSSGISPIRIETSGYRSANATQRALFTRQADASPPRRSSRSRSRASGPAADTTLCQLVTPLVVHTSQEVNAVSATGQVLVISQTLVRSAHASSDVRRLMNHLAGKQPLISNEVSQVDIDYDNEHTKHEVFVGSDAILIQRVSTIHRGRDRNTFETDDRRTYRFVCQGDLLPEDRRDKQSKPRHLTIIADSATAKDTELIEKSERVVLIFDAADKPSRVLAPMPPETSLTHANFDLVSKPSALKDSPVSFEEHVRVSQHSHINIVRKARVQSCDRLWDEQLTELKEQRVYKQQLTEDADCEPVRITRSHSMSRGGGAPTRDRSLSASRRPASPSRVERGRTPGRVSRNGSILRPLAESPLPQSRRPLIRSQRPDCTPSAPLPTDLLTGISPIRDEPARRETPHRRRLTLDLDDTADDSVSLPERRSPTPKTLHQQTMLVTRPHTPAEITTVEPYNTARSVSRSPAKQTRTPTKMLDHDKPVRSVPRTPSPYQQRRPTTPMNTAVAPRTPSPYQQRRPTTPMNTARAQSPRTPTRPAVIIDEDTSAGSSQSPTQNRTPTTVSPRRARLATAVYQSPAGPSPRSNKLREPSSDPTMHEWERMLDTTQPQVSPARSDSRPAKKPLRVLVPRGAVPAAPARPLSQARSCANLSSSPAVCPPLQQRGFPLRRAISEHSVLPGAAAAAARVPPAAPANSAVALASPFRRQLYIPSEQRPAAPQPRVPRTTRPAPAPAPAPRFPSSSSDPAVAVSASASATRVPRQPAAAVRRHEFALPHTVVGKPAPAGPGAPTQKNVELVQNPDDYDEGEILKKCLTLEAKINGHIWNLSVIFALKADRADLIRFAPKRVRIDDQTLWEETENWSQTSLTPVTGPRTVARGSESYDQLLSQLPQPQTMIRVSPKTIATASTASSASSSRHSADKSKKGSSNKSNNSKSGDKKKQQHN